MKLVFDLTPLYDHLTGIERYTLNVSKSIIKHHPEAQYILLFKNEVHKEFSEIVQQENVAYKILPSCNKLMFIQWRLWKALRNIDADYYIFLSFTSPVLFNKGKIINAIHDLTCWDAPETIPSKMKLYYRYTYKKAARISWKVVTVSKFSQKQICNRYNLPKSRVPIIYDGLTEIFKKNLPSFKNIYQKYSLPQKYILSLSTLEPRKNLQLLISAYEELIESGENLPDLVLAGRQGWKLDDVLGEKFRFIKNKVHFTGFVDDNDLPELYREAEVFVFPSKYEGFGLPIIEAMSQGVVVLSSDAASLPEVVQNAGLLFKSEDLDDLKEMLLKVTSLSDEEKDLLRDKGKKIAYQYDWDEESEKLYQIMVRGN